MAAGASAGATSIAWVITAVGMLLLVATFKTLADRRPDLKAGIYQPAYINMHVPDGATMQGLTWRGATGYAHPFPMWPMP